MPSSNRIESDLTNNRPRIAIKLDVSAVIQLDRKLRVLRHSQSQHFKIKGTSPDQDPIYPYFPPRDLQRRQPRLSSIPAPPAPNKAKPAASASADHDTTPPTKAGKGTRVVNTTNLHGIPPPPNHPPISANHPPPPSADPIIDTSCYTP